MRMLLPLLLLVACKSTDVSKATQPPQQLVSLATSGCFGYCPIYVLTVWDDGRMDYMGKKFVEKPGADTVNLTAEELKQIKTQLEQANVWQYPEVIPTQIADAPFTTLTVFKDGKEHHVQGSIDRPQPLLDLEKLLKNTAEAHGLKVLRGVDPNVIPEGQRREMLVLLQPDVNAGNWIMQFKGVNLQLLRRTGEENRWLVGYDPKQIDEASLLELLRTSEGAVEATPNRRSDERH